VVIAKETLLKMIATTVETRRRNTLAAKFYRARSQDNTRAKEYQEK